MNDRPLPFYQDLSVPFSRQPARATVSHGLRDEFWLMSMTVGIKGAYDCIKAFSETDLTEDLEKIDVPTLDRARRRRPDRAHRASAMQSSKIVKDSDPEGLSRGHRTA